MAKELRAGGWRRADEICILLLEDSDIDAELLAAHLAKANLRFSIRRVLNRKQFVAALDDGTCDIVLADFSLPDFDGLSALNIARALQPETPFIFVSGVVGEEFATNALKRGATDYVIKRNLARLGTAVERALDQAHERAERRRAEEALKRTELSARIAADAAKLGLWDYEPTTGNLKWDERCKAMFDLPSDAEVTYDTFLRRVHPADRARMHAAVLAATTWSLDGTGAFEDEFRTVTTDGSERWLATHGHALFENEVCTRFVGVIRDITKERRDREALRQLATDLEQQVAARTAERDGIWRLSADLFTVAGFDGRLRRLNPAWAQLLGYDPDSLVGSKLTILVHPEDQASLIGVLHDLSKGRKVERFENRVRHADGTWRWIAWTAAPEGDVFYGVGRDQTRDREAAGLLADRNRELASQIEERERVEHTLRQMQRLEAVGQLTSGVAHDFNNLLTVILGNIGIVERALEKLPVQPRLLERIGQICSAAERGAKLTGQLLAFSRRQKLDPEPINLNETVSGMHDLLQSTMGGSVRIEMVLKPDLWPALVDPTQTELIILNLAINARDAMEVGGALMLETANIRVPAQPVRPEEPAPGEYVVLTVSDTGSGMTPDVLAKAFEPFFTTKEVGKGSGLGLAQVYGFAKQSGGGVRIETHPGEGTRIEVYLPRAAGSAASLDRKQSEPVLPPPPSDERTVLLIDDDTSVREVTAEILGEIGYSVMQAGSGSAALDLLKDTRKEFGLLLIDYAMPGMNGVEVAREVVKIRPDIPILFITGYADLRALHDVGDENLVRKPFRREELARKVRAVLGERAASNVVRLRK